MNEVGWTSKFLLLNVLQFCVGSYNPQMTISRYVELEGFHKVLGTEFLVDHLTTEFKNCSWVMDQEIPSGAYVDPYQIEEYERTNAIPHNVQIIGYVDIEAPQHHAADNRILVFFNDSTLRVQNKLQVTLPFHLRYHKSKSGGGSAIVRLCAPKLLFRCNEYMSTDIVEAPCCHMCQICDWNVIHSSQASEDIIMQVPVGNLDHREFVTFVTLLMIIGGCYYIIRPVSEVINF